MKSLVLKRMANPPGHAVIETENKQILSHCDMVESPEPGTELAGFQCIFNCLCDLE